VFVSFFIFLFYLATFESGLCENSDCQSYFLSYDYNRFSEELFKEALATILTKKNYMF